MDREYLSPSTNHIDNQTNVFCHIGRVLTSSLEPKEVFQRVMDVVEDFFAPQYCSLLLVDEETKKIKFEIVKGGDEEKLKGFCLQPDEGIVGWVCTHTRPIVVEDVRNDPRFSHRVDEFLSFTTKSVVCVPLLNGKNQVIGAIELINKILPKEKEGDSFSDGSFTESDMGILNAIGSFAGIAAENAFLYQRVSELAMIDSLTETYNRHYFNDVYHREVDRLTRYGQSICVLMMDVDGLKTINDQNGHLVGDQVLKAIAQILKSSVRVSDVVARYGGDEFIILMPKCGETGGRTVANRIQALIQQWNASPAIANVKLGLSIGIHEAGPDNAKDILLKADQKLYQEKSLRKKTEELTGEKEMRRYLRDTISG
jgi:diguanylate cyclase (GGDEF)-like protein